MSSIPKVTIYHNPVCGTSRATLGLLRDAGFEPEIIEYLKTPPTREQLTGLIADAGLTASQAIRSKEKLFTELGLDQPGVSEQQLLDAMLAHPVLINRPFVVSEKGTRLCRPSELAREILP
jgi:arsenate reductase